MSGVGKMFWPKRGLLGWEKMKYIKQTKQARLIVHVHVTYCMYLLHLNGYTKKVVFVVKQYAIRKAKIRPWAYAGRKLF